jgi:transcriptional regulator with XRE-family HTH domain
MFENNIGEARRAYAVTTESGKFTQEDAARAIGVATGTYRNWEQGIGKGLKGEQLAKLSELYGVTVDYLLKRTDRPRAEFVIDARATAPLKPDERELLELYRSLDVSGREMALCAIRGMASHEDTSRVAEGIA